MAVSECVPADGLLSAAPQLCSVTWGEPLAVFPDGRLASLTTDGRLRGMSPSPPRSGIRVTPVMILRMTTSEFLGS